MIVEIRVEGSGERRTLAYKVGERWLPLLDGTGEPALFDKRELAGAQYGMDSEAARVLTAISEPHSLRRV